MPRKVYDATPRVAAGAYCPKCKITCWYKPGDMHLRGNAERPPICDGILIDIKEKPE